MSGEGWEFDAVQCEARARKRTDKQLAGDAIAASATLSKGLSKQVFSAIVNELLRRWVNGKPAKL